MGLPRKQRSEQGAWLEALEELRGHVTPADVEPLVAGAVAEIRERLRGRGPAAYAWSGGKDSLALELVAERAGVSECALVITDLEYPAFLAWATDNMPHGLTVVRRPLDLEWLAAHPAMLFPRDAATASRWFANVQHRGQRLYAKRAGVDVLLLGRRVADGNYIGSPDGMYVDREGFTRYSPLRDWTHEDVLRVLAAYALELPPCYSWPRGFRVGTGPWPARQWTDSIDHGWTEVFEIDPDVVRTAATRIESAGRFLGCADS